jgi:hypothetical protein
MEESMKKHLPEIIQYKIQGEISFIYNLCLSLYFVC